MKAILLVRVSTKTQDFDEQERAIYEMAIKDGYSPDDIIPICEKESGIKLSEEERAGLNRMKELIETDNAINCVYCWEVSRIARRKKINFSVLDYLINHKVQLVIKEPSIRLFKDNGDIDEGAEMIFTLFSQMAESEMRTKLARWKRTKDAKRKESYYTGGWLLYGYKVDEKTRKIVPDESAAVVEQIFNMYLTGKYSYGSLAKELIHTGIFNYKLSTARSMVSLILNNTAYAGLPSSSNGYNKLRTEGNVYPAIVTLEMIERCKKIAEGNVYKAKKQYNNYYFGKGLLRCPYCGGTMVAKKNNNTYHCQNCDKGFCEPGRPKKEKFDAYRDITEHQHRIALEAAFTLKDEYGYQELAEALKDAYASVGVPLSDNKVVSLITILKSKRMIVQENGKKYRFMPDFHY